MPQQYVVIDETVFELDGTQDAYDAAYEAMRAAGLTQTPVYEGAPDDPDSYQGSSTLLLKD